MGITDQEYEIVKELYEITIQIYNEIMKIKNKEQISNLKKLLEIEESIYKKIDDYSLVSICDFIMGDDEYKVADMLNYTKDDYERIIKSRIINKLNKLIESKSVDDTIFDSEEDTTLDLLDEIEDEQYYEYYPDDKEIDETIFDDLDTVKHIMEQDIIRVLIKLLDNNIIKENDLILKEKLNIYKCNLLFTFNELLEEYLQNNYSMPETLYLNVTTNKSFYNLSNALIKVLYEDVTWPILEKQIDSIDYKDLDITKYVIRSTLIFTTDKVVEKFKYIVSDYEIDFLEYLKQDQLIPQLILFRKKNI